MCIRPAGKGRVVLKEGAFILFSLYAATPARATGSADCGLRIADWKRGLVASNPQSAIRNPQSEEAVQEDGEDDERHENIGEIALPGEGDDREEDAGHRGGDE